MYSDNGTRFVGADKDLKKTVIDAQNKCEEMSSDVNGNSIRFVLLNLKDSGKQVLDL